MNVLIINYHTIGEETATGVTLQNIFSNMENTKFLQYTLFPGISGKTFIGTTPLETISNKKTNLLNRFIYNYHKKSIQNNISVSNNSKNSWKSKLKLRLKKFALTWNELLAINVDRECIKKIKDFSPEVIYTLGADINVLRNAIKLSDILGIPIVVHNMDDLYHAKFKGRLWIHRYARKKLQKLYKEAYKRSRKSLAIGPKMAEEYETFFGLPFDWAMNCVNYKESDVSPEENLMIFSGGLHGGRANTLLELANAVENSSLNVCLEIFTSNREYVQYESEFKCFSKTKLLPFVPKSVQIENISRANALVHAESFDEENISYFRLSMSTKIAEYTSVGKPILCIGPREIATVDFIKKTGMGVVVNDIQKLPEGLEQMMDVKNHGQMEGNVKKVFAEYFHKPRVQEKILEVFRYNIANYRSNENDKN